MVCLLAAPWVQLSVSAGNGWPRNALRHHWLMPISCHLRDCKALLVTSLTHVSGAIASVQTFTFTAYYIYLLLLLLILLYFIVYNFYAYAAHAAMEALCFCLVCPSFCMLRHLPLTSVLLSLCKETELSLMKFVGGDHYHQQMK